MDPILFSLSLDRQTAFHHCGSATNVLEPGTMIRLGMTEIIFEGTEQYQFRWRRMNDKRTFYTETTLTRSEFERLANHAHV